MKKIMKFLFVGVVLVYSCNKSSTSPSGSAYTPSCTGVSPSFKKDVMPIFNSVCSGCHNQFTGYSSISSDQSIRSMIVSGSMPKSGSLTTTQRNAIVCWIDNGTPNN